MTALFQVFRIFSILKGAVSLGKILFNAGKLIRLFKSVKPIFVLVVKERRPPSLPECRELIHAGSDLLKSGVIDFPGIDEAAVARALDEIEAEIEWPKAS